MTNYYVDPDLTTGTEDGSSAANGWRSLQDAIDGKNNVGKPAAGDTVLLKHGTGNDETPAAIIDFDVAEGTSTAFITWKGVNSSWVDDGTSYIIDGGSTATSLWAMATEFFYFKNIELNNAQNNSIDFEGAANHPMLFDNCKFHNPTNSCFDTYSKGMLFYRCHLTSAGSHGYYRPWFCAFVFCVMSDNTGCGVSFYHFGNTFYGCICHNNGSHGIYIDNDLQSPIFNCVIDGNTGDGLQIDGLTSYGMTPIIGNRITNNAKGLDVDAAGNHIFEDFNFYLNNTVAAKEGSPLEGGNSLSSGTEGYNNRANNDFNLTSSATLRRTAIDFGYGT